MPRIRQLYRRRRRLLRHRRRRRRCPAPDRRRGIGSQACRGRCEELSGVGPSDPGMTGSVVIVGASVAGVKTAQALRSEGYAGEITLVDAENVAHAYDKPPLSKGFLTGENKPENIRLLGIDELERLDAEFRWGAAAVSLDITDRRVRLASGEELTYDVLVIATGARARPSPWTPHPKVVVLRTAEDADRLRRLMKPGGALSIIGSGFVGAEVAATAIKLGLAVTLI